MDWLDYREKLGIGFDDAQKVKYFRTNLFNFLQTDTEHVANQITEYEFFKFCNITGTDFHKNHSYNLDYPYNRIVDIIKNDCKTLEELLAYYVAFLNCQEDTEYKQYKKDDYLLIIVNLLAESHMHYEIITDKDGVFIFPKGVKEFDDALVSQPLRWLSAYPKTEKAWAKALREYSDQNDKNASDIADLFRKALETFFQEFFQCNSTLENMKSVYGKYMKDNGVPKEISGNLETVQHAYTNYMNNYAKHHDATSDKLLEYLMYETGNIIRLLITIKNPEVCETQA